MQTGFKLEDFFLKIFKGAVLVLMSLSLVAILALLAIAAWDAQKKAVAPEPARKAVQKEVTLDELKKALTEKAQPETAPAEQQTPAPLPPSLKYLEDVTRLYRCSTDFARKVNAEIEETDNAVTAGRVEDLRSRMEGIAQAKTYRGERYIASAVQFTCAALGDPAIIAMRKEGKIKSVFFPVLDFHLKRWDAIEEEKAAYESAESARVEREKMEEAARIQEAKARALLELSAAGIAFGVFMVLALYLVLAKIEINLRALNIMAALSRPAPAAPRG